MFKLFTIVMLMARLGFALEPNAEFQQANQLYDQGKFAEAKSAYGALIAQGPRDANVFYNLGNTEFRLGQFPAAILAYERALALEPNHPEANANLIVARKKAGSMVDARQWFDSILVAANQNTYLIFASIAGWVFVFVIAMILLRRKGNNELAWGTAIISFAVAIYAGCGAYVFDSRNSRAIVISTKTEARFEPFQTSAIAQTLNGGSHVKILRERGAWDYCRLPDGSRRWVMSATIEPIRGSRS